MTDRTELRRLAEALVNPKWERGYPLPNKETADKFRAAASPDVVLGLLDEIERTSDYDLQKTAATQTMEIAKRVLAERDQLRAVAVRLKGALLVYHEDDGIDADCIACQVLADPEVEKL